MTVLVDHETRDLGLTGPEADEVVSRSGEDLDAGGDQLRLDDINGAGPAGAEVGHHVGSANPGESSNSIISAHNDIFGEIFRDLPELDLGDEVFMHTASRVYRYVVTQKRIIEPTDVSVMYPTSSPVLTLISCYPYGIDTHRIVVIAELQP